MEPPIENTEKPEHCHVCKAEIGGALPHIEKRIQWVTMCGHRWDQYNSAGDPAKRREARNAAKLISMLKAEGVGTMEFTATETDLILEALERLAEGEQAGQDKSPPQTIHSRCPACDAHGESSSFSVRGQFCLCGWQRTRP